MVKRCIRNVHERRMGTDEREHRKYEADTQRTLQGHLHWPWYRTDWELQAELYVYQSMDSECHVLDDS